VEKKITALLQFRTKIIYLFPATKKLQMKKLSRWASHHIIAARTLIVILQIVVALLAIFTANQLSILNIHFSLPWIYVAIVLFISLVIFYPHTVANPRTHFKKQKTFDFLLVALGFCLVTLLCDQLNQPLISSSPASASSFVKNPPAYKNPEAGKLLAAFKSGEKSKFSSHEKRIIRKEFKYQLKKFAWEKITGRDSDSTQTLLTILTITVAVGLFLLIASLACEVSCSGSDAGAILIVVLGTAGLVWACIAIIRAINRGAEKRKKSG
jgi:hypothetical protein